MINAIKGHIADAATLLCIIGLMLLMLTVALVIRPWFWLAMIALILWLQ